MSIETAVLVRRNVWALPDGDETLAAYAAAVRAMRERDPDHPTSWVYQAAMHGTAAEPQAPLWNGCQHGSWFFLPWHRMYLYFFERIVRAAVKETGGPADWALPFWDYGAGGVQATLPRAFRDTSGGENPLFVAQRDPSINSGSGAIPLPVGSPALALGRPLFVGRTQFGGDVTGVGQFWRSPGMLEQTPHNAVHGLVGGRGGLMSNALTAGLDPIFWLHHANIDRLWQSWRQGDRRNTDPEESSWKNGPASQGKNRFIVPLPDGTPWEYTPEQMSDFAGIGYTYSDYSPAGMPLAAVASVTATPPGAVAMAKSTGAAVEVVGASAAALPIAGKGAQTSVRIDKQMHAKVAGRLAATTAAAPGARPEQVFLNLENVRGYSDATVLQVYLQFTGEDGGAPVERQVGSIGLFGITRATETDAGHAGTGLSYVLNITKPYAEFVGSTNVGVRLQAVAPVQQSADVSVGRISIVRQGD